MSKKDDGGPAFPSTEFVTALNTHIGPTGMSLRDWFAGQALAGWLASYGPSTVHPFHHQGCVMLAQEAYAMADAMLAERKGPKAEVSSDE